MAKKDIRRTKYPLEDNIKRIVRLNEGNTTIVNRGVEFATREETDAGTLTTKAIHPDGGAYAYDRFRWPGQHYAGKGTQAHTVQVLNGVAPIDCKKSNVFELTLKTATLLGNPTAAYNGQVINIIVAQDAVGGHALTFGDAYLFVGGYTPEVSTAPGAVDLISMQYRRSVRKWLCTFLPDFTGTGTGWSQVASIDIEGLTAEDLIDSAADYFVFYDASADANRKTLASNVISDSLDAVLTDDVGDVLVDLSGNLLVETG